MVTVSSYLATISRCYILNFHYICIEKAFHYHKWVIDHQDFIKYIIPLHKKVLHLNFLSFDVT